MRLMRAARQSMMLLRLIGKRGDDIAKGATATPDGAAAIRQLKPP